jgi:acetyltransferase-like isoleucine patch superfamily enzyme
MPEPLLDVATLDRLRDRLRAAAKAILVHSPDLLPYYWRWVYFRGGIEGVNALLITEKRRVVDILRLFGAHVGDDCSIYGPLYINSFTNYSNLTIGRHVHIGQCVFLDLGSRLQIEDEATVSMRSTILTHQDVGDRPLAARYPRLEAPVTVGRGAYLGAGAILLPGSSVGQGSVVGAGAVVVQPVPAGVVVAGSPAELKSTL